MNGQTVFGKDMLFNLMSIVYWRIVTTRNQRQVNIYNFQENVRRVSHEYAICYLVYVENTCIYRKSDYNNQGPYIITEVFTHGIVQVQRGAMK